MFFLKKKYVWALIYGLMLTAFTFYVVMNTFVITKVYSAVPSQTNETGNASSQKLESIQEEVSSKSENSEPLSSESNVNENDTALLTQSPVVTENSYSDPNISITITEDRVYDTSVYVAEVYVSSGEYLKTALAQNSYGKNITQKTSEMAENNNAVLAINGDFYGTQTKGYVIRNGVLYRETASANGEDLVIGQNGSFAIVNEGEISAQQLLEDGAAQVLSFGPALLINGEISVSESEEVGKAKTSNPRTALGVIDDLHYVFVVSDGRTEESAGLTLHQLAEYMHSLGVEVAYNLDGGGSSTMYFNGKVINNPTTNGNRIQERRVSDIVYIG
ncbi:MAG: phosphodiester glycosidase family protein [Anaerotignum sp.]|nr:phosphodiester glycosidase family protein [Anaerotignum sp.]